MVQYWSRNSKIHLHSSQSHWPGLKKWTLSLNCSIVVRRESELFLHRIGYRSRLESNFLSFHFGWVGLEIDRYWQIRRSGGRCISSTSWSTWRKKGREWCWPISWCNSSLACSFRGSLHLSLLCLRPLLCLTTSRLRSRVYLGERGMCPWRGSSSDSCSSCRCSCPYSGSSP